MKVLCTVKDSSQLVGVFAFVEGAADRSSGLGEENVGRDQQIGVLRADRMPVHPVGCDGDFRTKSARLNATPRRQRHATRSDGLPGLLPQSSLIEELRERSRLRVGRNRGNMRTRKPCERALCIPSRCAPKCRARDGGQAVLVLRCPG